MMLTINEIEAFFTSVLVSLDHSKDVLLDLSVRDAALMRTIFGLESGTDVLSEFGHIDNLALGAVGNDLGDNRFATKALSSHVGPFGFVSEMLVEGAFIPCAHRLQTVLLLKKRVDRLEAETVVDDLDNGVRVVTTGSENDSSNLGASLFKSLNLLDSVGEFSQDEFVISFNARVDDSLEHFDDEMVQIALVILAGADLLVDLAADVGVTFGLFLDKREHVEFLEALGLLQLINDQSLLLVRVIIATGSDEEESRLN